MDGQTQEQALTDEQINAQAEADFLEGFGADDDTPGTQAPEVKPDASDAHQEEGASVADESATPAADPAEPAAEDDPVIFDDIKKSQLKTLLAKAARVDQVEEQLRRVEGRYGELKGSLNEIRNAGQKPTQTDAPAAAGTEPDLDEFERDFPEVIAAVERRIQKHLTQTGQAQPPAPPQSQEPSQPANAPEQVNIDLQMAVLDEMHEGWRDTVQSDDFTLWLTAQPKELQQTYANSQTAREFGNVLSQFKAGKQAAQSQASRNKQRLESAVLPSGHARSKHEPTAEEQFLSGFYSE